MSKQINAHLISHTHWDREWYLTREVFRTKLVRLIDGILDLIDSRPDYVSFMMDGQTIALEDYVEIRPENRERLQKAVSSGRLLSGPWYILPDELLVSGEAHIRNYLVGSKVADQFGRRMNIAYLPDSFGHPEQMPQIVEGLGLDAMVFWRGASNQMEKTEFWWQSPYRESKVLCIHMPCGYGNSARLANSAQGVERLTEMIRTLHEKSHTDTVLLMNGSDHISAQEDIVEVVRRFNESGDAMRITFSTLEDCIREIAAGLNEIETYSGELRYGDRSMLLGGTLSTRMYLKQANHQVQKRMERYLEPMMAYCRLKGGARGFHDFQTYLWKKILENHPHDSICGCSVDAVHQEMETRFQCVEQLQEELLQNAAKELAARQPERSGADAQLLLFEPTQDALPAYLECTVDLDSMLIQDVDFSKSIIVDYADQIVHPALPHGVKVTDELGREIPCILLEAHKDTYQHLQDDTMPEIYQVNRLRLGLMLPGFSYGTHLLQINRREQAALNNQEPQSYTIENEYYQIQFEREAGCFTVTEKRTGRAHSGVHRLVDKGDAGDEYTYSWPETDRVYGLDAATIHVEPECDALKQSLRVSGLLRLPKALEPDRKARSKELVDCPVEILVSLFPGVERIDFVTTLENRAFDHRLQVQFPAGDLAEQSSSSGAFAVTRRQIAVTVPEEWMEYPQTTHPTHGFADVSGKNGGVSLASEGMAEYEAENIVDQSYLNLTLLRCVGWLSRTDLLTRHGNGGWTIPTPDAQCLGRHRFSYSIVYHQGDWRQSQSYEWCERALHPARVIQLRQPPIQPGEKPVCVFIAAARGCAAFRFKASGKRNRHCAEIV